MESEWLLLNFKKNSIKVIIVQTCCWILLFLGIQQDCIGAVTLGLESEKHTGNIKAACSQPTRVTVEAFTKSSVLISWTAPTTIPENGYDYEVRSRGVAGSGSAGLIVSGTTSKETLQKEITGLTPSAEYWLYVRSNCGNSSFSAWTQGIAFATRCDYAAITSTTPAIICGSGTATLSAEAAGGQINWYGTAAGNDVLATGATFTTPELSADKTYWIATQNRSEMTIGGLSPTELGGKEEYTALFALEASVEVLKAVKLISVIIFPKVSGNDAILKIVDADNRTIIASYRFITAVNTENKGQTVLLNQTLPPGNYNIVGSFSPQVKINAAPEAFEYNSEVVKVKSKSVKPKTKEHLYGFYNWKFEVDCISPRKEVKVKVLPVPAALNASPVQNITIADAKIKNIDVGGVDVKWYASEADALTDTDPLDVETKLIDNQSYYAMQNVMGCKSSAPFVVTVSLPKLGMPSFDSKVVRYYPNPVETEILVTYKDPIDLVEVLNLAGQTLISVKGGATTVSVPVAVLQQGIYMVRVTVNEQSQVFKIIKK